MASDAVTSVLLSIPTCGRPWFLRDCLASVSKLAVPEGVRFEVLLLDNNPDGSAAPIHAEAASRMPFPLHYARVPQRGVVHVRNRAIEEAVARGVDALAFFDDDDVVATGWLAESLRVLETCRADVVTGPAHLMFPEGCARWCREFWAAPRIPTGVLAFEGYHCLAATRNVVFRARLVRDWGLRFRTEFNLSGGEDTYFFEEARRRGAVTAWAADAPVYEHFPASRATFRWFLQRRFRHGFNRPVFERMLGIAGSRGAQVLDRSRQVLRTWIGDPAGRVWSGRFDTMSWIHTFGDMADTLGALMASLGYDHSEYHQIHGR